MSGSEVSGQPPKRPRPARPATSKVLLRYADRSISRWTAPRPEEPAYGFMMRLGRKHHAASATEFAEQIGVERITDAQGCLDALTASRLADPVDIEILNRWTPRLHGMETRRNRRMKMQTHYAFATVAGETVRRDDWSLASRRSCPACLAESEHHRVWFDLVFVRVCPIHGKDLTDVASDGSVAGWLDSHVGLTRTGGKLSAGAPRLEEVPDTLEAYALGRLGIVPPTANALLDGHPLQEVLEAIEMMGRLRIGGRTDVMPKIGRLGLPADEVQRVGYEILSNGEEGARRVFAEIAGQAPETAFGAREIFGWAYTSFFFKEDLSFRLREIMLDVATNLGLNGRRYAAQTIAPEADRLTLREVGTLVGCGEDTAKNLAVMLGVILPHVGQKGTPLLIAREDVARIRELHDGAVTRADAARRLRVDDGTFAEIVLAGHVPKVGTRWGDEGLEDRFAVAELDRFLDRIWCLDQLHEGNGFTLWLPPGLMTISEALSSSRYDAGLFFNEVFAGRLVPFSRTNRAEGLAGFLLSIDQQPFGHPFVKRCMSTVMTRSSTKRPGMTQKEACALLDINPSTAKALTDLGYLRIEDASTPANRRKLDGSSVSAFAETYAAGKLYAPVLGCFESRVPAALKKRGIEELITSRHPDVAREQKLNPLYDRAMMRQALGLHRDPDLEDPFRTFWKQVAKGLGRSESNFMVWLIRKNGEAFITTSDHYWPVTMSVSFGAPASGSSFTYMLRAEMVVDAADRALTLAETVRRRDLPAPIHATYDPQAQVFRATLDLAVTTPVDPGTFDQHCEYVLARGEKSTRFVHRIAETMKGALEEGVRPYSREVFGDWPWRAAWW